MAAGVTDRLWDVSDIVTLVEAKEAAMKSNGTAIGFKSSKSAGRFACSRATAPIGPSACLR